MSRKKSFLDLHSPFFVPVWRRVAVVVFCLGWAAFEFVRGAPFWGVLFGALGAYAAYQFFVNWPETGPDDDAGDDTGDGNGDGSAAG